MFEVGQMAGWDCEGESEVVMCFRFGARGGKKNEMRRYIAASRGRFIQCCLAPSLYLELL